MTFHQRLLRRVSAQAGFTIVEVMVSVTMLSVGLLAVAGTLDVAGRTTVAAQRHEQAIAIAQREIEELRSAPYASLGHAAPLPVHQSAGTAGGDNNPRNPNFYVIDGTTKLSIKSNYRDSTSAPAQGTTALGEELVDGGTVQAGPETVSVAGTQATIYRYVTWRDAGFQACPLGAGNCRAKRVTVAIVLNSAQADLGPTKPVWVSTYVSDPEARPPDTPQPVPAETGSTAQPFFLYDSTCNGTPPAVPATPTASHATHDTSENNRTCSDATRAPDLMGTIAPPGLTSLVAQDYSNEVTRPTPRNRGLGLVPRANTTCPAPVTNSSAGNGVWEYPSTLPLKSSIHTWASKPMPAGGFNVPSNAKTAFSYHTEAADGVASERTMCVILRKSSALDTVLASAAYTDVWPTTPEFRSFLFTNTPPFTLAEDERLLVTVSVYSATPGTGGINLLYDHPAYPTSLTVSTTTPLTN